jgi:hypothetical protein
MIILLNQEDNCENIGKPWWHYLSCQFQSALQEKTAPILINASLLNAFIEKRKSIEQMSKIKGTEEQKALDTYNAINQRLNVSYAHLRARGFDPLQSKQLMLDEVNKQFYSSTAVAEAQKKSITPITENVEQALRSYLTKFIPEEWNVYTNNKSLYLFIPKKYAEQFPYHDTLYARYIPKANESSAMGNFALSASWETMHKDQLGLKLNALTKVENINDAARLYFNSKQENKYTIAEQLHDFFVTKTDSYYRPYQWNIIFRGHGGTWYNPKTDSFSEVRIADLPIPDFQNVLDFYQNKVVTHSFHYATCFGSGKRIQMAFDNANNPTYNFPIISECTSDGVTYCMVRNFKLPNHNSKLLEENDITADEEKNWKLHLDFGYNWTEYFNQMSQHSFEDNHDNNLCQLYHTLGNITENMISNIPQIRLSGTKSFIPALSNNTTVINDAFISYHQEQTDSAYTLTNRFAILVKSSCVPFPLIFENTSNTPHVISLIPGPSKQYFKSMTFKNPDHALNAFWQVPCDRFDRYFIAETVTFDNEHHSELLKMLGITEKQVVLTNVMAHSQTEDILRLLFQTTSGKTFMIVANKTDAFAPTVSIKGAHELTPEVAQIYLSRYNQIKQELFGSKV